MEGNGLWEAEPGQVERHTAGFGAGRMRSLEESLADSVAPEKGDFSFVALSRSTVMGGIAQSLCEISQLAPVAGR